MSGVRVKKVIVETTELSAGKNSHRVSYCETMRWSKNEGRLHLKLILKDLSVYINWALMEHPTGEQPNPLEPLTAPQPVREEV